MCKQDFYECVRSLSHTWMFSYVSDKCLTVNSINHPAAVKRKGGREARDKERKGDRKKRSSLRPLFFIKLIHGHKSLARRLRQGLISQASKTQPWKAISTKVWFPFVSLWSVLYSATLHWCLLWIGYNKDKREEGEWGRGGDGVGQRGMCVCVICVSVGVSVSMSLYVY